MKQPLGYKIGNWFEVEESIDALKGEGPEDVMELSHLLSGTMIYLGGKAESVEEGIERSREQVENGQAYQKWLDIVEEQGGDISFIKNPSKYPIAKYEFELKSDKDGYISEMDAFEIGTASVELGAGRKIKEDDVDPQAGIVLKKKVGDKITKGETILVGYTNKPIMIEPATAQLYEAVSITDTKPEKEYLVTKVINNKGIRDFRL